MMLKITSPEALDSAVAEIVRMRIKHTQATAAKDADVALVEKRHQTRIVELNDSIAELESRVYEYCVANRPKLFTERKSRETPLAVYGFELTPYRVETSSKKITWKEVVKRLLRLKWGQAYVRQSEPKPDKDALLTDRDKFTEQQLNAIGIRFAQDEQFFIRPKPESAQQERAA